MPNVSISGVIMKVLFYLISSIIIVAPNYTLAEEAPSNIYKPKYEILKYKIFREFPDKAKLEQEWKAMPFDSPKSAVFLRAIRPTGRRCFSWAHSNRPRTPA